MLRQSKCLLTGHAQGTHPLDTLPGITFCRVPARPTTCCHARGHSSGHARTRASRTSGHNNTPLGVLCPDLIRQVLRGGSIRYGLVGFHTPGSPAYLYEFLYLHRSLIGSAISPISNHLYARPTLSEQAHGALPGEPPGGLIGPVAQPNEKLPGPPAGRWIATDIGLDR